MNLDKTKVDHLYSVKIQHDLWNDAIILIKPNETNQYIIECIQGAQEIQGTQMVDKNCYLTEAGDYILMGHKSEYPEEFL